MSKTGIGFVCGGVISKSTFDSDPWAYMMCYYMPDDKFADYVDSSDDKERKKLFDKYARSAI